MLEDNSIFLYKDYGKIVFDLKTIMDKKKITISKIAKITGLHHKVVRRYYEGTVERYDKEVLSKFCFVLWCDLKDIMHYERPKK